MNLEIKASIPRMRWLAALGSAGSDDAALMKKLDDVEKTIFVAARPKAIYRVMDRHDVKISGISLEKHLEGCRKVVVMALTLGIGVDNAIRKAQVTDMAAAVIMDSGASVLTEMMCDDFEAYIREHVDGYMTERFSPGYGDSPLELQKTVVTYIDGQRKIGLNVTADSLMMPRKSVTAFIGLADHPVTGRLATCEECVLRDKCTLRREGKSCGD